MWVEQEIDIAHRTAGSKREMSHRYRELALIREQDAWAIVYVPEGTLVGYAWRDLAVAKAVIELIDATRNQWLDLSMEDKMAINKDLYLLARAFDGLRVVGGAYTERSPVLNGYGH